MSYRIGILVGNKTDDYLRSIRLGVQNVLEEGGHTLVDVADLIPYHTNANTETYLRVAFEIASRLDLDATVVPLGSVQSYVSGDWDITLSMLDVMDPAHTIVMERDIPGYRCITKDNRPGMRECMRHLIETCGFTRIAFVSGVAGSVGARERETVYFEEMEAHGLEIPEGYFVRGRFSGHCYDVIDKLIEEHPDIEAIACAADMIAVTAYRVMRDRKLVVGRDIAITGFDDQAETAHMDPPLTTVHMTGYDFGRIAGREALRLCEGEVQEEFQATGSLVVRSSCGENTDDELVRARRLIRQRPFPADEVVQMMVGSTLTMAGPTVTRHFTQLVTDFVDKVLQAYVNHRSHPGEGDVLFQSQDLADLFGRKYQSYISLEGFHATAMTLLEALLAESSEEDVSWVVSQISYLHLRVARLLNSTVRTETRRMNIREWRSYHLVDDALAADTDIHAAYRLMLGELRELGVRQADLFLLPETVTSTGGKSLGLSDTLHLVGRLTKDGPETFDVPEVISLQDLVPHVLPRYGQLRFLTVGPVMAGNELLGVLSMDPGLLDSNGQLMALLDLGLALKHLQMLENEHEMNELLNKNNLVLELQSQRDEMTGLLNRRGLNDGMLHRLRDRPDRLATLMYLDLDGLKNINDSLGHDAGDVAIKAMATVLTESLPEDCMVARMGGDEFVVFTQVESPDVAEALAADIQEGIERHNAEGDGSVVLSASCGVECFYPVTNLEQDVQRAMTRADERMYEQKRHRRTSRRFAS